MSREAAAVPHSCPCPAPSSRLPPPSFVHILLSVPHRHCISTRLKPEHTRAPCSPALVPGRGKGRPTTSTTTSNSGLGGVATTLPCATSSRRPSWQQPGLLPPQPGPDCMPVCRGCPVLAAGRLSGAGRSCRAVRLKVESEVERAANWHNPQGPAGASSPGGGSWWKYEAGATARGVRRLHVLDRPDADLAGGRGPGEPGFVS